MKTASLIVSFISGAMAMVFTLGFLELRDRALNNPAFPSCDLFSGVCSRADVTGATTSAVAVLACLVILFVNLASYLCEDE